MSLFKEKLLSLIDSSAKQATSLVNDFADSIDNFDWDSQLDYFNEKKNALIERGNSLMKDFGDLLKQVKDSFNDFSVTVPFDEAIGEKLDYSINGNKLKVAVTYEDDITSRSNETVVVIPENCDITKVKKVINTVTKTAIISIPKTVTTGNEEERPRTRRNRLNPRRTEAEAKPKLKRDARGRFVKIDE